MNNKFPNEVISVLLFQCKSYSINSDIYIDGRQQQQQTIEQVTQIYLNLIGRCGLLLSFKWYTYNEQAFVLLVVIFRIHLIRYKYKQQVLNDIIQKIRVISGLENEFTEKLYIFSCVWNNSCYSASTLNCKTKPQSKIENKNIS